MKINKEYFHEFNEQHRRRTKVIEVELGIWSKMIAFSAYFVIIWK